MTAQDNSTMIALCQPLTGVHLHDNAISGGSAGMKKWQLRGDDKRQENG